MEPAKYRYPTIDGDLIERVRKEGRIRRGFEIRVVRTFYKSVVDACAIRIGKQLRDTSREKGTSGKELGDAVGRGRTTTHNWFTHGIYSFEGLVLATCELELEWHKLKVPSVQERAIEGYLEAITHIRRVELGQTGSPRFKREEFEYLIDIVGNIEWLIANELGDYDRLELLAEKFKAMVESRLGKKPNLSGLPNILRIYRDWNEPFQLCLDAVLVTWLEKNAIHN